MRRPDPSAPECDCSWLKNAANDPHAPVEFDKESKAYHLMKSGPRAEIMIIYHCPFCGGRAPNSHHDALFHFLTHEEVSRLNDLSEGLVTVADVLHAFGAPDIDLPSGAVFGDPGDDGEPGKCDYYRCMRYLNLSPTIEIQVAVYPTDRVHFTYLSKPVEGGSA